MKISLYILILCCFSLNAFSQVDVPEELSREIKLKNPNGTEFWLCFMKNHNDPPRVNQETQIWLELFFASDSNANVTVEIKSLNFKESIYVPKGTIRSMKINPLAQITSSEIVEQGAGVHITADKPINVYGLNRRKQTTDSFLGLPTSVIGKAYRAICYNVSDQLMPEFAIVATEDNTTVEITPTVETSQSKPAGQTFKVKLNRGDVYQVSSKNVYFSPLKCDLTGSLIIADKNISFFSGHQCAYIPDKVLACNHLVEQLPPIPSWGKHFYIGMLKKRSIYTYRVLANEDDTKIFENTKLIKTLNAGQFYENQSRTPIQITSTKPVLVAQYSEGFKNGDQIGDPMMLLIPPTQQFLTKYRIATPINGSWEHYINIIAPTQSISTIRINGNSVGREKFSQIGNSRYSIAYINLPFGTYELEGEEPFGMSSYGFGYDKDMFDAYGTIGGQSFLDFVQQPDTLKPTVDIVNQRNEIKVIVRDDRETDLGLKYVSTSNQNGIRLQIPKIEAGTPMAEISIYLDSPQMPASINLEVSDVAGNLSQHTICYYFDHDKAKFVYSLNDGHDFVCQEESPFEFGAFLNYSFINHNSDFVNSGNMTNDPNRNFGSFSSALGTGGWFGLLASYKLNSQLALGIRLTAESIGGTLEALDNSVSRFRNPDTGELEDMQEGRKIELNGLKIGLWLGGEYFASSNFYIPAGLKISINMTNSIDYNSFISFPQNKIYTQTNANSYQFPSDNLTTINFANLSAYFGAGVRTPILNNKLTLFAEAIYEYGLTNIISDGNWTFNRFGFNAGVRIKSPW